MKITPHDQQILCQWQKKEPTMVRGVIIPTAKGQEQEIATIIEVGWEWKPEQALRPGRKVILDKHRNGGVHPVTTDQGEFFLINMSNILAFVE